MRRAAARLLSAAFLTSVLPAAAAASPASFLERSPAAQVTVRAGEASPSLVTGLDLPLVPGDPTEAARTMLLRDAEFFGFDPSLSTLEALRPQTAGPFTVHRFHQRHLGLPVLGADVAVTVDRQGHVRIIGNALVRLGQVPTTFLVDAEQAVAAAIAVVKPEVWSGKPKLVRQAVAGVAGEWRPVWEVQLNTSRPLGAFRVWVDAFSGEVLQATNRLWKMKKGYAYPNCPEAGAYTEVDLLNLTDNSGLKGAYVDMYSDCEPYSGGTCAPANRVAKPDVNGDYLLLPSEGSAKDGFAEVHTFFHLNQMHDWFAATGFTALDFSLPVAVNYAPYPDYYGMSCNAAYGESSIFVGLCDLSMLGSSGFVNFAYDSLSVMHEYTHAAVDHGAGVDTYTTDSWGLVGQQMGLHEGFADFFPAVVLDDPKVGRHVGPKTGMGEYFRTLTDFRSCPANVVGESHDDGQIWGSANWEAYVAATKDPQVPLAVFEGLLALSTRPTFQDAANAVLAAALAAHPTVHDALLAAYSAHGLLGCGREVEIASGQKVTGSLLNPQNFGLTGSTTPFVMQYKVMVPANATSLAFTFRGTNQGSTTNNVKFYIQYGSNVVYKATSMTGTFKTTSYTWPSPPPGPYYILPVGTNYGSGWNPVQEYGFEVTATVTGGEAYDGGFPWYPDAGVPGLDAAIPGRDAASPGPDAAAPGPDAALAGPDAASTGLDVGTVVVVADAQVVQSDANTVVVADAAQPAGLDATASSADTGGGAPASNGCGCGFAGSSDPVVSSFLLLAGLAFATSLRRRGQVN